MKLATVGTSWITESFIEAAKESGRFVLHSVYSRDIKKAMRFAEKNGANYAFASLDDIAGSDADVVYIASPNSLHFDQAMFFLNKRKNVICEKPLVTKAGQFSKLVSAAEANGVFVFEALRHIHTPGFNALKMNVNSISPVRGAYFSFNQYSSKYDAFKEGKTANVFNKEFDGGAKFDIGIYPVSLAIALFGAPKSVRYAFTSLPNGVCGAGAYIFEYNGFLCSLTFSKISEDLIDNQIIGERGGISFSGPNLLDRVSICLKGEQKNDIKAEQHENLLYSEVMTFAGIIENNDNDKYRKVTEISRITSEIMISY